MTLPVQRQDSLWASRCVVLGLASPTPTPGRRAQRAAGRSEWARKVGARAAHLQWVVGDELKLLG